MHTYNFGGTGSSPTVGVITWVQLLAAPPAQNLGGQKLCKILCDLGQLSTLTANISGMD